MSSRQLSQNLCDRLSAIGIPKRMKGPIVDQVCNWVTKNGAEWTVQRLKGIKNDLVRSWAGLKPTADGVKYVNGKPKGPIGGLWSLTSPRGKFKAISALQIYTAFLAPTVTKKQMKKFISSVVQDRVELGDTGLISDRALVAIREARTRNDIGWRFRKPFWDRPEPNFDGYPWSPERRAPSPGGYRTHPEVGGNESPYNDLVWLRHSKIFASLVGKYEVLRAALPAQLRSHIVNTALQLKQLSDAGYEVDFLQEDHVGKISFIQEPGYKLRAVANPLRVYQVALTPLQRQLDMLLQNQPFSAVHDQLGGVKKVQSALRQGKTVHSVDLSDATNNFPLSLQLNLLTSPRLPFDKQDVNLFSDVSRSPWIMVVPGKFCSVDLSSKLDGDDEENALFLRMFGPPKGQPKLEPVRELVTWSVGQPLGLAPSFAAFSLTHGALLTELWFRQGGNPRQDPPFVIVGDDVAVWNDRLHEAYRNALSVLNVPVSENKCLSSDTHAEFCGQVISKEATYPQLKWRMVSDNSFVDVAKNLGPQSLSLFTPPQRRILKLIAEVPEELGGLGWNPSGKSWEERANSPISELLQAKDERRVFFEKSLSRAQRFMYTSAWIYEHAIEIPMESPRVRPGHGVGRVKESILSVTKVTREGFPEGEVPDSSWSPARKVSDPRGPSRLEALERKLQVSNPHEPSHPSMEASGKPKRRSRMR